MLSRSDLDLLMTQAKDGLLHRRYDQVIKSTTEVLKHDAKRLTAYLLRAEALRKQGLNDRAMADLAVAIRLDPNQPQPYVIRAEILKRQNRLDQAIADTTEAILLNPNLATAYAIRGECRRLIGDVDGARQDADELFRLDPTRSIGPAPEHRSNPPKPRFETEEDSLKPTAARRVGDGSELFADRKPVDRSMNLRKAVGSDDVDPLADAADYRPEIATRPIPRSRNYRRRQPSSMWVALLALAIGVPVTIYLTKTGTPTSNVPSAEKIAPVSSSEVRAKTDVEERLTNELQASKPEPHPRLVTVDTGVAAGIEETATRPVLEDAPADANVPADGQVPQPIVALTFDAGQHEIKNREILTHRTATTEGRFGSGLLLDGSAHLRLTGPFPDGSQPRTLCVWIKDNRGPVSPDVHVVNYGPYVPGKTFGIMVAGKRWFFYDRAGGLNSSVQVDTSWHHHALAYDGKRISYFYDGKLVAQKERPLQTGSSELVLGKNTSFEPASAFVGVIDDLAVFDKALSPEQIQRVGMGLSARRDDQPDTIQQATAATPSLPEGRSQFQGHSYKVFNQVLTWHQAKQRCEEMGGYLAIVESEQENEFIARLASDTIPTYNRNNGIWLGASDEATEGEWRWLNKASLAFTKWGRGQPNNKQNNENYLLLFLATKEWSDQPAKSVQHTAYFACEWDQP